MEGELRTALEGTDIGRIRELALEVHAMVHPAEISGRTEKTIADYVLDYMLNGNQNALFSLSVYIISIKYGLAKKWFGNPRLTHCKALFGGM